MSVSPEMAARILCRSGSQIYRINSSTQTFRPPRSVLAHPLRAPVTALQRAPSTVTCMATMLFLHHGYFQNAAAHRATRSTTCCAETPHSSANQEPACFADAFPAARPAASKAQAAKQQSTNTQYNFRQVKTVRTGRHPANRRKMPRKIARSNTRPWLHHARRPGSSGSPSKASAPQAG
jgi:hypothetical protein